MPTGALPQKTGTSCTACVRVIRGQRNRRGRDGFSAEAACPLGYTAILACKHPGRYHTFPVCARDACPHRAGINTDDPVAMADFYSVTLETYLHGQEWAQKNLATLNTRV